MHNTFAVLNISRFKNLKESAFRVTLMEYHGQVEFGGRVNLFLKPFFLKLSLMVKRSNFVMVSP